MRKITLFIILSVLIAGGLLSCSSSDSDTIRNQSQTSQGVSREPAKAKSVYSVYDVNGGARDMSEWIGRKAVVVNFWGTWCGPCRREIPGLIKLYDEYKNRGVEIVSLALERQAGPRQVKQFTEQAGMGWVQLMGNQNIAEAFQLTGSVPTTIFYDATGKEVARHVGARPYEVFKPDFEKIASGI
jgi:thiol-disulfide isomerase/thioredoxin